MNMDKKCMIVGSYNVMIIASVKNQNGCCPVNGINQLPVNLQPPYTSHFSHKAGSNVFFIKYYNVLSLGIFTTHHNLLANYYLLNIGRINYTHTFTIN